MDYRPFTTLLTHGIDTTAFQSPIYHTTPVEVAGNMAETVNEVQFADSDMYGPDVALNDDDNEIGLHGPHESTIQPYLHEFIIVFVENILIYSKSPVDHEQYLQTILQTLRDHKLYTKLKKREFWITSVHFLGHVINKNDILVDPQKVAAIMDWPQPTNVSEIRNFLDLADYYWRFVQDFLKIVSPLTLLTQKNTPFEWTDKQERCFHELKNRLVIAPILALLAEIEGFVN
ncbi:uncharacterized protein LOC114270810 [Camellia sinensis]|uniref:uncharacterized protein LOC114270810 n=1 Tax=Camellia sinensis TaxID=4442 RepID=UPI00103651D5|nr:uncharacterized protein LOC114270810 [Camellia sinensis]